MLNSVSATMAAAGRAVTLRHPNAQEATIYKKTVSRVGSGLVGGIPTIGGMAVLDSEDEADYTYTERGDVKVLFTGQYEGGTGNMVDADNGTLYSQDAMSARVECVLPESDPGYFVPGKSDIVAVEVSADFVLPYEIVAVSSPTNIPPYVRIYLLQPRSDMDFGV